MTFVSDQTFKNQNYAKNRLPIGEYENCVFERCDFSNGYLDNQYFLGCVFVDCNLSNTNIANTTLSETNFSRCKMMGLKFECLNDFILSFTFDHCILNMSSFYQMQLRNQLFVHCKFIETDFTEADMTNTVFDNCDLQRAHFEGTVLEKADFRTASNLSFNPEKNKIKKAKFSKESAMGLLGQYDIVIV